MTNINSEQIASMEKFYRINLINSIAGYKSLNLLGTISADGITNLSIVSSAFHLGSNPPLLGIVMRPEREHNDTLSNIRDTGHYSLNNVQPEWLLQAHQTSASYPSGVSEFDACGFTKEYVPAFKAPFVRQSAIRIGLEVKDMIGMEINGTTIVIGEVIHILTDNELIGNDGLVDHERAETMVVAGLDSYYLPKFTERLTYAKPGINPKIKNQEIRV
ncbi:flavin reductase family protein [Daejeonella sp.]|uniref:flavin reductase family protein n=1 Tax=Daejeonella sp. TaxID=2805397 RepID=UPI0039833279